MQPATNLATTMVPNPHRELVPRLRVIDRELTYVEDRIRTERALRDDPLGQMHHRRQIGEAQYQAGRKFQATWEAAGTPLRSPGNIIEHVDGGRGASDGITDKRVAAGKDLARWRSLLGHDYALVEAVLIDKRSIRELADASRLMMPGPKSTVFHGHLFRRQLTALAKAMGFG
jgi:hypothetical protein